MRDNKRNICGILSCDSGEMFLQFFRQYLNNLFSAYMPHGKNPAVSAGASAARPAPTPDHLQPPEDFLLNHISGSFVNLVQWWIRGGAKETPEELAAYFEAVTRPVLAERGGLMAPFAKIPEKNKKSA